MDKKALSSVKVIEYADGIGAPFCGKLLADMGATVIKVERPGTGDNLRSIGPFLHNEENIEKSCSFFYVNTNKESVVLDLDREAGREIMLELLKDADIFLRYGQPEWYEERGLDWGKLHTMNPGLIVASITPYGESGPYKDYKANPINYIHMSGIATLNPLNSWPDLSRCPVMEGGNFEQYDVGTMAAVGLMAALYYRNNTGHGQYMELSEVEAIFQVSGTENTNFPIYGFSQDRLGKRLVQMCSELAEAKDGWVCPYFVQDHEYINAARVFGREDWIEAGWLTNDEAREPHRDEFKAEFRKWLADKTREEACTLAQKGKVAMAPVMTMAEAKEMEQFKYREFFTEVDHPVWGKTKMVSRPFIMEKTPMKVEHAAPMLGEHTEQVLKTIGMDEARIAELKSDGVIA